MVALYGRVNNFRCKECELTVDNNFEGLSDDVALSGEGDDSTGDFENARAIKLRLLARSNWRTLFQKM